MARLKMFRKQGGRPVDMTAPVAAAAGADPYAFQASHRRLAWLLRISAGTNIVLGAAVTVLVSTVAVMLPLKTTEIALVRQVSREDKLYKIEPINEDVDGFQLLLESMARRYVNLTVEIDSATQNERLREASHMTDPEFGERFYKERVASGAIRDALDSGLTREVLIEGVNRIGSLDGNFNLVVDFIQVDRRKGVEVSRKPVRAYLVMTTRPQEVKAEDRYTNPLGIIVTDMVLKERETE